MIRFEFAFRKPFEIGIREGTACQQQLFPGQIKFLFGEFEFFLLTNTTKT